MKIGKYTLMLLTCAAMALPSPAQDYHNDSATAIIEVEDAKENQTDIVAKEERPMEENAEESESRLIPACLGFSVLTLITSLILLFITIKKKPNMESEKNNSIGMHNERDAELQLIKTQIQQIQTLILKQSDLLNQFATQINNLKTVTDNTPKQQETVITTRATFQQSNQQPPTQKYQSSPLQLEETFVATASIIDGKVVLRIVDNQYAGQAPFEIKVRGEQGIYNFNTAATKSLLNYVDTKVTPYCNSSIDSANILTRIDTTSSGTIIRSCSDWLVVQKAHIHIS